jgi:hypothetical protein
VIRPIDVRFNDASPVNVAVIGARSPSPPHMIKRTTGAGITAPTSDQVPQTANADPPLHGPFAATMIKATVAPKARIALAVSSTSSPSSNPVICVSPTQSAINARCEIDLSPVPCATPLSGPQDGRHRQG